MAESVQYITNEQGERVAVLLDLALYNRLASLIPADAECLVGLSRDELRALANGKLAAADQSRLDELVASNEELPLSGEELAELDDLLAQADQLTILKTRARYTLERLKGQ